MRRALIVVAALAVTSCSGSSTAPSPTPSTPPPVVTSPAPATPPLPTRGPEFDQTFWNEFVHDSFDAPGANTPLRRLAAAPMLYLKTVDEAGRPIDFSTLNTVQTAMRDVAALWSGGAFSLAGIEQGTATKAGQPGWLTVIWPNPSIGALCGRSAVGGDGGVIELNYLRQDVTCGCNASRMRPRTAKHELGHAFGYWHTDSDADLMRNGVNGCVDSMPSAREIYHATIAYQSPVGTANGIRGPIVAID